MSLSPEIRDELLTAGLNPVEVEQLVRTALAEDFACGPDVTSVATVDADTRADADVVARATGVMSGIPVGRAILHVAGFAPDAVVVHRTDGEACAVGDVVLTLSGNLRNILSIERTLLNFLTHLSGVATATRTWVDVLAGTRCTVRDTRKTLPGLRQLEKYAVRCGGGTNHRFALGDAALLKDNHVAASGGIESAVARLRTAKLTVPLEVECDTVDQVRQAVAAGISLILLDNMTLDDMAEAVAATHNSPGILLEASGGVTLANARAIADLGIDFIAVGALTHSAHALDLALDVRVERNEALLSRRVSRSGQRQ